MCHDIHFVLNRPPLRRRFPVAHYSTQHSLLLRLRGPCKDAAPQSITLLLLLYAYTIRLSILTVSLSPHPIPPRRTPPWMHSPHIKHTLELAMLTTAPNQSQPNRTHLNYIIDRVSRQSLCFMVCCRRSLPSNYTLAILFLLLCCTQTIIYLIDWLWLCPVVVIAWLGSGIKRHTSLSQ